jgi:alpha-ketoglutarate-dependent 2,4-dichlorophenoxyacetate dioxygenase
MPHAVDYSLIQVKELHPTFGAEVSGVDFSRPVPEDVFQELWKAVNQVRAAEFDALSTSSVL